MTPAVQILESHRRLHVLLRFALPTALAFAIATVPRVSAADEEERHEPVEARRDGIGILSLLQTEDGLAQKPADGDARRRASDFVMQIEEVERVEDEGTSSRASKTRGDLIIKIDVTVNVNSGNVFGPAGPPGRPSSIGDRSEADRDRHVRELEETIGRLRAELEALRDRREPSDFRERFERMRREAEERADMARRRAEEMRRNMEENLRRVEPPREAQVEGRERDEEAREPERVDGVREREADRERDEQETRDDGAEATSSILPTLFETLRGFEFDDSE